MWAKLWLDELLPDEINAVLLLDCDTLIRSSLTPLWQDALRAFAGTSALAAAVVDVGIPRGDVNLQAHFGWDGSWEYFNAGVMALNLEAIRAGRFGSAMRIVALKDASLCQSQLLHKDQDALNLVLRGRYAALPLCWNVQGAGTYAKYRIRAEPRQPALFSEEELTELTDKAKIVHFTGTASPTLSDYLNSHVLIATKPWAFFCHNPFTSSFWQIASKSAFPQWRPEQLSAEHAESDLLRAMTALNESRSP